LPSSAVHGIVGSLFTTSVLAKRYNISQPTITDTRKGRSWRDLGGDPILDTSSPRGPRKIKTDLAIDIGDLFE